MDLKKLETTTEKKKKKKVKIWDKAKVNNLLFNGCYYSCRWDYSLFDH